MADARAEPALVRRDDRRRDAPLSPAHGRDMDRRVCRSSLCVGRCARHSGRLAGQPQRAYRDPLRPARAHLSRPMAERWLACGNAARTTVPRPQPSGGRDGTRRVRLPLRLLPFSRSGAMAAPRRIVSPLCRRRRSLDGVLPGTRLWRLGIGALCRPGAPDRAFRLGGSRPCARPLARPVGLAALESLHHVLADRESGSMDRSVRSARLGQSRADSDPLARSAGRVLDRRDGGVPSSRLCNFRQRPLVALRWCGVFRTHRSILWDRAR